MKSNSHLAILFFFLLSISLSGQSTVTPEDRKKANEVFTAGDWNTAAQLYKAIADKEPQNWNAKMRLGIATALAGKAKDAVPILEEAVKINANGQTLFALASANARLKNGDVAFETLKKAIASGYSQLSSFESDAGFATLKSDKRYTEAKELLLKSIYPCRYSEQSHQFDFWLGEWDVKNTAGQFAGSSKIERLVDDCVILENWVSAQPQTYSGKSINLYNSATQKWMQTWFDDKGGVMEFIDGEYKNNALVFVTRPDPTKNNQVTRLTFFNLEPNHVRQLFETSTDGTTWTTTTDLHYFKIKK